MERVQFSTTLSKSRLDNFRAKCKEDNIPIPLALFKENENISKDSYFDILNNLGVTVGVVSLGEDLINIFNNVLNFYNLLNIPANEFS